MRNTERENNITLEKNAPADSFVPFSTAYMTEAPSNAAREMSSSSTLLRLAKRISMMYIKHPNTKKLHIKTYS